MFDHKFPSPVSFSLARFSAPIHCVSWSPFHRNLVAASGAFQGIHVSSFWCLGPNMLKLLRSWISLAVFNVLERTRLMVIDSGEGQIFSIMFSPHGPFYILAGTEAGSILLFDLRGSIQTGSGTQITPNANANSIYASLAKKFELAKKSEKELNAVMSLAFNHKM
ncbi:unnamed protein product [Schistocephalus solidus]|uniref:Transcription factor WD40-like family n=1 Tax=Schistocephalus solidus TaxID=70667 RepID=A0A183SW06_SCHSO|nr:unnamed protein product [Schistocephalus solidus]